MAVRECELVAFQREECFLGVFAQRGQVGGAARLLLGKGGELHALADRLMGEWTAIVLRIFVRGGVPLIRWRPVDERGRNYALLRFTVDSDEGEVVDEPTFVDGRSFNAARTSFILDDLRVIEANASQFHRPSFDRTMLRTRLLQMLPEDGKKEAEEPLLPAALQPAVHVVEISPLGWITIVVTFGVALVALLHSTGILRRCFGPLRKRKNEKEEETAELNAGNQARVYQTM
ncbi:hypothetical protein M3Y99_00420200 [Aphelenchoides fujianensis]|nr:hypothetical protein M3Y99_00420200 [Aphelenchoides fujianensis]